MHTLYIGQPQEGQERSPSVDSHPQEVPEGGQDLITQFQNKMSEFPSLALLLAVMMEASYQAASWKETQATEQGL